jgi:hypothetical protein
VAILWSELFEQTKERDEVRLRIDAKPVAGSALRASHEPGKLDVAEGIAARGANGRTDALKQLISGDGISRRLDETGVSLAAMMLFLHGLCLATNSWDRLALEKATLAALAEADAVSFGTLAQRRESARGTIQALLAAVRPSALRILDFDLRQNYFLREIIETSLRLANIVKFNDSELPVLADMLGLLGSARQQIEGLARQHDQRLVCLTHGPHLHGFADHYLTCSANGRHFRFRRPMKD